MDFYEALSELAEAQLCCDLATWAAVRVADNVPEVREALAAAQALREDGGPDLRERAGVALAGVNVHIYACCEEGTGETRGWRQRGSTIKENAARAAEAALRAALLVDLGVGTPDELAELAATAVLGVEAAQKRWFWSVDAVGMPGKRSGKRRATENEWAWEFLISWVYGDVGETAQKVIYETAAGYEGQICDLVAGAVGAVRAE